MDAHCQKPQRVRPRVILHGGAGNVTRANLPASAYQAYRRALLSILDSAQKRLDSDSTAHALDVAVDAVAQLEDCALFNAGHGAVYTTAGTHELEASVMVSRGARKRGVGVMRVTRVRNPVRLAREMLLRGEAADGGGAAGHCQLEGETCDRLAREWGLERVEPSYFWTKRSWDQHRRGLGLSHSQEEYDEAKRKADEGSCAGKVSGSSADDGLSGTRDVSWDGFEYLPQGTVGAVVLDSFGVVAAATSTGGLTNKLPGRIGDTPTIGAGFFAEEWTLPPTIKGQPSPPWTSIASLVADCLPALSGYTVAPAAESSAASVRAVGMSGTGNGDSFLRLSAVRTASAMAQFYSASPSTSASSQVLSLQKAVTAIAGPGGSLQRSAGDRWGKTGEGEGGIIGIDFVHGRGAIVFDFNCGGMLRAWADDEGMPRMMVFREEF